MTYVDFFKGRLTSWREWQMDVELDFIRRARPSLIIPSERWIRLLMT